MKTQISLYPLPFQSKQFEKTWEEWIQYRKERRLPRYVPIGLQKTFSKLIADCNNDEKTAIRMIENSISHNWQGIFAADIKPEPKPQIINASQKQPPPKKLRDLTAMEMEFWIQEWREKTEINIYFVPLVFYEFLERKGDLMLTKEQKHELLLKAIPYRKKLIVDEIADGHYHENYLRTFNKMEEDGCFTGDEVTRLKNIARQIAVAEYLKK